MEGVLKDQKFSGLNEGSKNGNFPELFYLENSLKGTGFDTS